nr:MAG TPA: hypothetical protein [Caudoviricetes sp.]
MIIWSKCRNKFTAQKNTIMSRIKSAKRYKIWGSRGFCCKFEDGCKAAYVIANRVFRRKTRQYLKLVKNGREIE